MQKYLQNRLRSRGALNETSVCARGAITVLKKICDHPALLTDKVANQAIGASKRRKDHGRVLAPVRQHRRQFRR